ncbi:hypothetical protein ColLi_06682 [Colletotrichum liriopes]|uniref:Uncharacterized protein n=1 Tax=Colletotrichum liriopes TaxID=708192 RepID=A0AA37LT27_9PEZI|nr:hypothetical protein ColLi_06682 [Colletotrichum liriopes]
MLVHTGPAGIQRLPHRAAQADRRVPEKQINSPQNTNESSAVADKAALSIFGVNIATGPWVL